MEHDLFNNKTKNREYWNGEIKLMISVIRYSEQIDDIHYQLQAKACRSQYPKIGKAEKIINIIKEHCNYEHK
ncbi:MULTISPECIES: hypothetical protein [unclassified Gilliamella]|uniref:hypothetical protein n=1 Tax=unclassified Gilliamella TaxID=2685620 RepID=UPI002269FF17|nr:MULTISPECIES: hypothetical protein [unclassified Gilliamella]MCX8596838.1 hypothetical protein [Gilliamella sp. B3493]MCX8599072.1 hypothetical protein [Gilliamella sp. B3486]MCX8688918.1 hypothetical protein [Gilliamella sp. B2973]MCX8704622.1 hypothetical protein [Gilliamella sp. B3127]